MGLEMACHRGSSRTQHSFGGTHEVVRGETKTSSEAKGAWGLGTNEGCVLCPENPRLRAGEQMDQWALLGTHCCKEL